MLLTYKYYSETYGGKLVSEEEFNQYNIRSQSIFNNYVNLKYLDQVLNSFMKDSVFIALSELVDNLYKFDEILEQSHTSDLIGMSGIDSETTKDHTVKFSNKGKTNVVDLQNDLHESNIKILNKHLSTTGLLYRGL